MMTNHSPEAEPRQQGHVVSVSSAERHSFSKPVRPKIRLIAGLGVEKDAHAGATVRHRYRVKQDPAQPNLCQVHLIHVELFHQLSLEGFTIAPGDLGENITTQSVDLLSLPVDTQLRIGDSAVIQLTGLRTPCVQLDRLERGLMRAMKGVDSNGMPRPRCGVMAVVIASGEVMPGDEVRVTLPTEPHRKMQCV